MVDNRTTNGKWVVCEPQNKKKYYIIEYTTKKAFLNFVNGKTKAKQPRLCRVRVNNDTELQDVMNRLSKMDIIEIDIFERKDIDFESEV